MSNKASVWRIFFTMLKVGALTFGGGYAMVPLFRAEYVNRYGWITDEDMLNMIALSQSIPGAIAINCSILVGYRLRRLKGAFAAVAGSVLPSLIVLTSVTYLYEAVRDNVYVAGALRGVRAAVIALLVSAFLGFMKPFYKDALAVAAFALAFVLSFILDINSIYLILGGLVFGVTLGMLRIPHPKKTSSRTTPPADGGAS
jgi:chromate transporter